MSAGRAGFGCGAAVFLRPGGTTCLRCVTQNGVHAVDLILTLRQAQDVEGRGLGNQASTRSTSWFDRLTMRSWALHLSARRTCFSSKSAFEAVVPAGRGPRVEPEGTPVGGDKSDACGQREQCRLAWSRAGGGWCAATSFFDRVRMRSTGNIVVGASWPSSKPDLRRGCG